MQPRKIAVLAREAADDKKAEQPVILDISKLTNIAYYFLITHGNSNRQVQAIAENIRDVLKKHKIQLLHVDGLQEGNWVVLDFGVLIVHVFHHETRQFYNLERLWGDAPQI